MVVVINTQNVIDDVSSHFLQELKSADSMPPKGTIVQALKEANARLRTVVGRYVEITNKDITELADDSLTLDENLVYNFRLSPRRAATKLQAITDMMHSYLVNSILTKSYGAMGETDFATLHDNQTVADAKVIQQLMRTKLPPITW